ncbi:hypothetical protein [Streptomyces sp. A012304]|uniref:hypothetical protein n=1 Tax=Streptomyces sp. A012304 TaxID=375446 RepID=UPI002232A3BA|nr:hypothetical protein [Streptomyces sp. A012304]GKQ39530.1 hypothetical protein ALMP_60570 [Streptomyces sp. A012304]
MSTELTQEQRDLRWKQAHTAIQNALAASWTNWRRTGRRPDFTKAADNAMGGLGDLAAEILTDGTMLRALTVKDGQVCLELEEATEILKLFVATMRGILHGYGAENYVETEMQAPALSMDLRDSDTPYDSYTVTVQRREGTTPHQFRLKAEEDLAAVMHVLKLWIDQVQHSGEANVDDLTCALARVGHPIFDHEHNEARHG